MGGKQSEFSIRSQLYRKKESPAPLRVHKMRRTKKETRPKVRTYYPNQKTEPIRRKTWSTGGLRRLNGFYEKKTKRKGRCHAPVHGKKARKRGQ